jgi:hypothetical protein
LAKSRKFRTSLFRNDLEIVMDPIEGKAVGTRLLDRLRKTWFPPAAALGAFAAFAAAAFRVRPNPGAAQRQPEPAGSFRPKEQTIKAASPAQVFARQYSLSAVLVNATSPHPFHRSLAGIAVGAGNKVFALGDDEIRIYDPAGSLVRTWKTSGQATCLAIGPEESVYVGAAGRVEIYGAGGSRVGGFAAGETGRPAGITAIKAYRNEVLVADAAARIIRRYDSGGRQIGVIGTKNKTGNFILPNRSLDIDVDARGVILATDTGRHRVTSWAIDGTPLGSFGKFGMRNPEDFVGCCNPVNLSVTPDGMVVTGEKMVARVKVYEPEGKLLAVIGPEHFDPNCIHIHLAVDSRGRILTADPVRREIKIFSPPARAGGTKPYSEEPGRV